MADRYASEQNLPQAPIISLVSGMVYHQHVSALRLQAELLLPLYMDSARFSLN